MQIRKGAAKIAAGLLLSAIGVLANAQVVNGDFESGLNPWRTYITDNGTAGPGGVHLADFDIDGDGTASKTAAMSVGYAKAPCPAPGILCPSPSEGVGIYEWAHFQGGPVDFHVDLAVENNSPYGGYNQDGGTFQLIWGGNTLGEWSVGRIDAGSIARGSIDVKNVTLAPIDMWFMVKATRQWARAEGLTQYIDNVTITPVPEPTTNAMLLLGVAVMAGVVRRKQMKG
jgi:hypothetical protein